MILNPACFMPMKYSPAGAKKLPRPSLQTPSVIFWKSWIPASMVRSSVPRVSLNVSAASGYTLTTFPARSIFARVAPESSADFALSAQVLTRKLLQKYLEFKIRI